MCLATMRFAVAMVRHWCFATTTYILGHSARAAGLAAVVIEKKNQIDGSKAKPGDITVQQYHRGFATSAFDVTITHPLQKKFLEIATEEAGMVAEAAHDKKL